MIRSTENSMSKEGRDESRRFINESFTGAEDYFAVLGPNKPSEKKKTVQTDL